MPSPFIVKDTKYYISIQTDPYGKINLILSISAISVIAASDQQPAVYNTPTHKKSLPAKTLLEGNGHHKTLPPKQSFFYMAEAVLLQYRIQIVF